MHEKRELVPAVVEYADEDQPFSVVLMDRESGVFLESWDVEWCERDQRMYAHMSGCGGPSQYDVPDLEHGRRVFVRDGLPCVARRKDGDGWVAAPISREALEAVGYEFMPEPEDPFHGGREWEGEDYRCLHCHLCDDWIPEEIPCGHMQECCHVGMCILDGGEHTQDGHSHDITFKCFDDYDEDYGCDGEWWYFDDEDLVLSPCIDPDDGVAPCTARS